MSGQKALLIPHHFQLIPHYCPLNDNINYVIVFNYVNFLIFGNFSCARRPELWFI